MHFIFSSSGENTCNHSLLQGTFPTQGLSLGLSHCIQILNCLSHQGNPYIHTRKHTHMFVMNVYICKVYMCRCIYVCVYIYVKPSE